ncbi:MAG: ubiquinol-cytochrome c reductase iron-sulfur subunit [Pseudomonadales bacterium]|jgi:ubiquinol-cytochrome c reductase iron-sulfur subunit
MTTDNVNTSRRRFLIGATSVVGGAGAVGIAVPFVASWNPSAKAKAAGAPVKYNLGKIEPGAMVTAEWRGQPVYIVRRTPEILESIKQSDEIVSDPTSERPQQPGYAKNEYRSIKEEFLILVGTCTHLGCAPKFRPEPNTVTPDWRGGFFCPCHGSKFDLAGRVYKGVPAPSNLVVPPHMYLSDTVVLIGEDEESA